MSMKIIIGLGNPDKKYELTRHNIGFMAINALAKKLGLTWKTNKKFQAEICQSGNFILAKPQTFMNESGKSARTIMSFYKLLPKKLGILKIKNSDLSTNLTVIHDDVDIDLGKYKISVDSRSAGHKGVESIICQLKTKNFTRIRVGSKTKAINKIPVEKFVLQKLEKEELTIINSLINKIISEI